MPVEPGPDVPWPTITVTPLPVSSGGEMLGQTVTPLPVGAGGEMSGPTEVVSL